MADISAPINMWNTETEKRFIELYKNKEILWQTKHQDYNNKLSRKIAYNELSKAMGNHFSIKRIKDKIRCLRTIYAREEKKVLRSIQLQGSEYYGKIHKPTWEHYETLSFLKEVFRPQPNKFGGSGGDGSSSLEIFAIPCHGMKILPDIEDEMQNSESSPPPDLPESIIDSNTSVFASEFCSSEIDIKTESTNSKTEQLVTEPSSHLSPQTQDENVYELFGRQVAKYLQDLPPKLAATTQIRIMQIIFKAKFSENFE